MYTSNTTGAVLSYSAMHISASNGLVVT